mmetsp:Transcript_25033/g.54200  ORF Transcript_25033/g.54200 Transcript_25033/m.54200 type:complete len:311 (+) Transcript_25033:427-1359(+)
MTRHDDLPINRKSCVKTLGEAVGIDWCHGKAPRAGGTGSAKVRLGSTAKRSDGNAYVGPKLEAAIVGREQINRVVIHQKENMIRYLGADKGSACNTSHPNRGRRTPPSAIAQPCHDKSRPKLHPHEAEPTLYDRHDRQSLGLLHQPSRYPHPVQIAEVTTHGRAGVAALLGGFRRRYCVRIAADAANTPTAAAAKGKRIATQTLGRYRQSTKSLGEREEIVERVRRLANFVTQRKGQRTVEQAAEIGGVDGIEPHGVGVRQAELLLDGLEGGMARIANPQRFSGQLGPFFQSPAVEEGVVLGDGIRSLGG